MNMESCTVFFVVVRILSSWNLFIMENALLSMTIFDDQPAVLFVCSRMEKEWEFFPLAV